MQHNQNRFAHKLEFGEKTHEVSMTALRLVSRMKKVLSTSQKNMVTVDDLGFRRTGSILVGDHLACAEQRFLLQADSTTSAGQ